MEAGRASWARGRAARVALVCACAALAAPAVPSDADDHCFVAGTTIATQNSEYRTWSGFLSGARAPDVVQDRRALRSRTIERWSGATGARRWRVTVPPDGGLLVRTGPRGDQLRVTSDDGPCGGVAVTSRDPASGRVLARRTLPGVATGERPDTDTYSLPLGDFDGDGHADVALIRTAQNRPAPIPAVCFAEPSGHCMAPPVSPWRARVDVVDGRKGRVLLAQDLGSFRAALPTAAWVPRGRVDALAIVVPTGPTSGTLSLYTTRGRAWQSPVTVGSSDALVLPVTGGVAVAGLSSAQASGAPVVASVAVVDAATGREKWARTLAGQIDVQRTGDGHLLLTDLATGTATKVSAETGKTLWQHGPDGTYPLWPILLPDVDGRGKPDVALVTATGHVVVAGEDGRDVLTLGTDDRPYAIGDVTGDGRADLAVVTARRTAAPTVRLVRGRSLTTVWTRTVAFGEHASALAVTSSPGRTGALLLHAIGGPTVAVSAANGRLLWSVPAPT